MKIKKFGYECEHNVKSGLGNQWKVTFDNGYTASIIDFGYGSDDGLYELAVLKDDELVYDTPITDDVVGYLSEDEVKELLDQVKAL